MSKKVQQVIRQTVRRSMIEYTWNFITVLVFFAFFILLIKNIMVSQAVPPLYTKIFNGSLYESVDFLKRISALPAATSYLSMYKNMYGGILSEELEKDTAKKYEKIKELEMVLQKNPKSRDAFLSLSILYRNLGEEKKADYYLNQAKEIDPTVQ